MIRDVIVWAALGTTPLIALFSPTSVTAQTNQRVADDYYAKRAQTQAALASGQASPAVAFSAIGAMSPDNGIQSPAGFADGQPDLAAVPAAYGQPEVYPRDDVPTAGPYEQVQPQEAGMVGVGYPGDGYSDGNGDPGACEGYPCGPENPNAVPYGGVLWDEIHSCRKMWASVDYLSWWVKGNFVPPLVTTAPIGTPQSVAGTLGDPRTTILFGNTRLNDGQRNGGRITVGGWIIGDVIGIEGSYYALAQSTTTFSTSSSFPATSTSDRILTQPFFDPLLNGLPRSRKFAFPNFANPAFGNVNLSGGVNIASSSDVQSAALTLKRMVGIDFLNDHRMFLVGGYRFFRLDEDLSYAAESNISGGTAPPGTRLTSFDSFSTTNLFNGGEIGLISDLRRGIWVLETDARVALGNMRETVNIAGSGTIFDGSLTNTPFGFLAQPSNIGHYRRDQFVAIPQIQLKLGLQLTQKLRATCGYNFTYVTRVARPGNEIDLVIDQANPINNTQTVQKPAYLNNPTDLWLQGVSAGLEYRF